MEYPPTLFRIKAILVDVIFILIAMVAAAYAIDEVAEVPNWMRIAVMSFLFIVYEPFMVSAYGGTLGHRLQGLEVRRMSDKTRRIGVLMAIVRVVFKFVLGVFSVLTSYAREDNRCIHDLLCDTVVVYRNQKEPT